jgi:hypothetical protein
MTVVGGEKRAKPRPKSDEIEQIKRLIEIQTQIVELAKQNELTEKECEALRRELSQVVRRPLGSGRSPGQFLRNLVQRLKRIQL